MAPPMKYGVCEVLDKAAAAKDTEEKYAILRTNANPYLGAALRCLFDSNVQWSQLDPKPVYVPCDIPGAETNLYNRLRKIHDFFQGGKFSSITDPSNPRFARQETNRQMQWVQVLESIHPRDAELLIALSQKKLPRFKGTMTKKILLDAFPELLQFPGAAEA